MVSRRKYLQKLASAGGLAALSVSAGCGSTLPDGFVTGGGGGGGLSGFRRHSAAGFASWAAKMEKTYGDNGVWGETREPPNPNPDILSFEQARTMRFDLPTSEDDTGEFYGISHHAVVLYRFTDSSERGRSRYLCWVWSGGQLLKETADTLGPLERPAALALVGSRLNFTVPAAELTQYAPNRTIQADTIEGPVTIAAPSDPKLKVRLPLEQGSVQPRRPGDPAVQYRTRGGKSGQFVATWTGDHQGIQSVNGACEFWYPQDKPLNPQWEVEFGIAARNFRLNL